LAETSVERADNDSPWKEILRAYFPQAIQFFFPATAVLVDWAKPIEFLDTQLQQITREAEVGRRFADLLVKVNLVDAQEAWLCLHLEVQATKDNLFPRRMLVYNMRIFDLFDRPAISLAILADNNRQWRPDDFGFEYPDTALHFRYGVAKLLDYKTRIAELEASDNPFALVVLSHLQAQIPRQQGQQRKDAKFALARQLYERGYQRQDVINLFRFLDWVIILPKDLDKQFWQELRNFEEQQRMPYITSVERIGFEQGLEEGRQAERALILRQLTHQVGQLPADLITQIEGLSLPQLEGLGVALLDFKTCADLQAWLTQTHI
jgi:Domain of unknown function (DUF4351)